MDRGPALALVASFGGEDRSFTWNALARSNILLDNRSLAPVRCSLNLVEQSHIVNAAGSFPVCTGESFIRV
jgi:hypothetical protein